MRPSWSNLANTKWSISLFAQSAFEVLGNGLFVGGTNAQCGSYLAPCLIHFLMVSISVALSLRLDSGGGIISEASVDSILATISDFAGFPGTMACAPGFSLSAAYALSSLSSLKPDSRLFSSGP